MLYDHQIKFLESKVDKTSLVWSCGTGKSRAACEWIKQHPGKALVVCPKALQANWERELVRWGATAKVMTKENFRARFEDKDLAGYKQIVVDEVHSGFLTPKFKSLMSKALRKFIAKNKIERVLLLSATVYTSSPWNIYSLAFYTGHVWNYRNFSWEFFDQIRMGPRMIPVAKKGNEAKLAELTKTIASVVDIHDCIDVPLQNYLEPEYFALTEEQKRAIKEAYDPVPIVRYTLQHEIENGILIGNEFKESQTYETDKIERIKALCKENKKVAIVCRYNDQILWLRDTLVAEGFTDTFIINGQQRDRDSITRECENKERAIVLIQADCGVGFQLPSFPLCIFASMSYSYTSHEQMVGRFLRMDKPSPTTFMYLLTEGDSIDQAVYDAVARKQDFRIQLHKK